MKIRSGKGQLIAVDLLRGLAAFEVMLAHVRTGSFVEFATFPDDSKTWFSMVFLGLTRFSHEAVLAFFVISGFLVGGALIERSRAASLDVRSFAIDRATRIFVPLVPAVAFTWVIQLALGVPSSGATFFGNAVALNGLLVPTLSLNVALWSLPYEVWFYIAALSFALLLGPTSAQDGLRKTAVWLLVLSAFVFSVLEARYFFCWGAGALAAGLPRRKGWGALGGGLILAIGVIGVQTAIPSRSIPLTAVLPSGLADAAVSVGFALLLPVLVSSSVQALLRPLGAVSAALAAFSYTLYLTHTPVSAALVAMLPRLTDLSAGSMAHFAGRLAICVGVAFVAYACFERQTPLARRWLKRKLTPPSRAAVVDPV